MTKTQTPGRPRRSCEWEGTKKKMKRLEKEI